jgi:predicted O-methyltransferase YrrM
LVGDVIRAGRRPHGARALGEKLLDRVTERDQRAAADAWAADRTLDLDAWAGALDPDLWAESRAFSVAAERRNRQALAESGVVMGGGGHTPLLHFLVRLTRPDTVVETGVAAGWSSYAILDAMARNGRGHLYSSDLPYLRVPDAERAIGRLVPHELRDRWTLEIEGDRVNLPRIVERCGPVDLVHYDSAKSARARRSALSVLEPHLAPGAIVVMDDIGDNLYFRDWAAARGAGDPAVFTFQRKHVGLVGDPAPRVGPADPAG